VVTTLACFLLHARLRVQRAPGIPHALIFQGREINASLGRTAPRELYACLDAVIASAAKQSSLLFIFCCAMDCFVALLPCANASRLSQAMTNSGVGPLCCLKFESVGRFFARLRTPLPSSLRTQGPIRRVACCEATLLAGFRATINGGGYGSLRSQGRQGAWGWQRAPARPYSFLRRGVAAAASTSACSPSRQRKISTARTG